MARGCPQNQTYGKGSLKALSFLEEVTVDTKLRWKEEVIEHMADVKANALGGKWSYYSAEKLTPEQVKDKIERLYPDECWEAAMSPKRRRQSKRVKFGGECG